ncbi:DUF2484 family protein [Pseudooceanicola marinus]|uniref:DUF2484 family protein n=1 Tax=Pseudooceanicola marinus TaxID=396013 RepID=UPI001C93DE55|nr:DUF2484 family protein [Pseudooceanicola marinus]MBY5972156.1 DUF2484 family protein [Ferrimonas balearica]MCA1335260.1 DUF2484 family protein [Pseudooceanicola marinus]
MSESILLAALWGVAANILAMVPSRDNHWSRAYLLIACGIPILGFVTMQHGPVAGLIVLLGGMSILRWPVVYLGRWVRSRLD